MWRAAKELGGTTAREGRIWRRPGSWGMVAILALALPACGLRRYIDTDAGARDGAGAGDTSAGGVPAGCTAGMACVPGNPCHEGVATCSGATLATCDDSQRLKANGTPCADGSVCRAGACVPCADGQSCPIPNEPCRKGAITCATGEPVCAAVDNEIDGTGCGTGLVCQAGACKPCTAGGACVPANPCHAGSLSCAGGNPTCGDTGRALVAGAPCGTDQVCDAAGQCQPCAAGASCMVPGRSCRTGVTVCNTGTPTCLEDGNVENGTMCGSGSVCSDGACVPCTPDLACVPANPCHAGRTTCVPVACLDFTTPLTNGTSCGTDRVCNGGACVVCASGRTCQPVNPCRTGTTTCASGVSTCAESGDAPNGMSCGTGVVCRDGACSPCAAGTACVPTNPCHRGTLTCDTGAAVCSDAGTSLTDGTGCGVNLVCRAGACVSCTAGVACQPANPCKNGSTSCATGSLVCLDASNKSAGTSCGTGMVCSSTGTCVPCVTGMACTPTNRCHRGAIACNTGAPVCVDAGTSLPEGTTCGTNLACASGRCAAHFDGLNVVFATSTFSTLAQLASRGGGTGAAAVLAGADAICADSANSATSIAPPGKYVAWISSNQANAVDRLRAAAGGVMPSGWVRLDGLPFLDHISPAQEGAPHVFYPLGLDEKGNQAPFVVATGTDFHGVAETTTNCENWTNATAAAFTTVGNTSGGGIYWTTGVAVGCTGPFAVACMQVDRAGVLPPLALPANAKRAFVAPGFVASTGLTGADARCRAEAAAAGLTGTFRALLASTGSSAASRFRTDGVRPYVRTDGVVVAARDTDLLTAAPVMLAPLSQLANGLLGNAVVFTGATTPVAPGSATCNNWTASTGAVTAQYGSSTFIGASFFSGFVDVCTRGEAIYCLED